MAKKTWSKRKAGRFASKLPAMSATVRDDSPKSSLPPRRPGQRDRFLATLAVILPVAVAVAVGITLRIYRLDYKGLWLDEVYTIFPLYSMTSISQLFDDFLVFDQNPPLYSMMLIGWFKTFGHTDAVFRGLSSLCGILAIPVFGFAMLRATGRRVAVPATILLSFSWPAIYYAQEIRSYSLLLLVSAAAVAVWLGTLAAQTDSRSSRSWLMVLAALSLVLCYIHLYGFIFAASLWLYLAVAALARQDPRALRGAALGFCITLGAFLTWMALNLPAMARKGYLHLTHVEAPGLQFLMDIGAFMYHHPVPLVLLGIGPVILGGPAVWRKVRDAVRSRNLDEPLIALFCVVVFPIAAVIIFSQVKPIVYTRYLMPFVPAVIALVAIAFAECKVGRAWHRQLGLLAVAGLSLIWVLPDYYKYRSKPQTREAVQWILERYEPDRDMILAHCSPEPTFICNYDTGFVSPRVSRYIHYLNYGTLPLTTLLPILFDTLGDADKIARRFDVRPNTRAVFVIGSRGHVSSISPAKAAFEALGYVCLTKEFFKSRVEECRRP